MANRERALAKNTFIISFGTFLPKLSSIITLPILTAYLTTAEYGTYDLINTLVSLFLPIVTLQIQSAAFRFLIDCRDDKKETQRIITNIIVFVFFTSIAALIVLFFVLGAITPEIRLLICLYFFFDILTLTLQQVVRGLANNKLYSISSVVQSIINMILVVLTVGVGRYGLEGVLISIIIATFISFLLLFINGGIYRYVDLKYLSKSALKELLIYSWPMIPNSLSSWVLRISDRMVITAFLGIEANAMYAVANKIPSLFSTVQSTFVFAWQENASIASKDKDADSYYSSMFDSIFCILVGIMALLIGTTPILFWLLIKGSYEDAYYQMPILFLGMLYSSVSSFMGGIYVAHKKTKSVGITTVIAAAINLIIDLLFVNIIGIYAGSVSTLVAYLFLTFYRMLNVRKFQKIRYKWHKIVLLNIGLIIMCILCWMNVLITNVINFIIGLLFAFIINKKLVVKVLQLIKKKLLKM